MQKLHPFCNTPPPVMMVQDWAESNWGIDNYRRFINRLPQNLIKSIQQKNM